jgi:hypothetical protein
VTFFYALYVPPYLLTKIFLNIQIMNVETENDISNMQNDIRWLARGPVDAAKSYCGFLSRGMRFRPKRLDRMTQNSGVMVTAKTSTFARAGDTTPVLDNVTY